MGINMIELMKNVVAIGSYVSSTYYGISPSILVDGVRITRPYL
jgi:predicted Zn-dependent protease